MVGDFNGDGRDDILWYSEGESFGGGTFPTSVWYGRPGNAGFLNGPTLPAPPQGVNKTITIRKNDTYSYTTAEYEPFVGDFNGDGKTDVYWFNTDATGTPIPANLIWYGATLGFTVGSKSLTPYPPDRHTENLPGGTHLTDYFFQQPPFIGDYNGDGKDDILWYVPGFTRLWRGTNGPFTNATIPTVYGLYEPAVGDFTGDGKTDVLWYVPGPAADSYWLGAANGFADGPHVSISGQYAPFIGDFNGDGQGRHLLGRVHHREPPARHREGHRLRVVREGVRFQPERRHQAGVDDDVVDLRIRLPFDRRLQR